MPPTDLRHRRGRLAEGLAAWWLRARGWSVPLRNVRIAGVEIDLLARRGPIEALVEVKARRPAPGAGLPVASELVSAAQTRRLLRAAEARAEDRLEALTVRVDLVVVTFGRGLPRLQHFEGLRERSDIQ